MQVAYLKQFFPTGSAYILGPLTSDHWVVFVADYCERPPQESMDVTLDIKMFDICDGMSQVFHSDYAKKEGLKFGADIAESDSGDGKEEDGASDSGVDADSIVCTHTPVEGLPSCRGPNSKLAAYVTQRTGLASILPRSDVHAFMFDPCGYSANGLRSGSYWTVHVTPEKHCSYASFETNVNLRTLRPLLRSILALFRP